MREYQLCGLGNAIVDIFVEISDAEFARLGFERGTMRRQNTLLEWRRHISHGSSGISGNEA